jgi:aspartyl-tRNA(Asn)/glutamyl-tRNA(Gln) amidotransferase subunit C
MASPSASPSPAPDPARSSPAATITRDTVLHVARLARLTLDEAEIPRLVAELAAIVGHFDSLAAIDTRDVPETAGVGPAVMPLRPDEPQPSLDRSVVLAEAPRADEDGFLVPGFVDE